MIIKNDEGDRIVFNEEVNLYSLEEKIKTTNTVMINGVSLTVDEFRKMKTDPKKEYWGRKAKYEIGENEEVLNF